MATEKSSIVASICANYTQQYLLKEHQEIHHLLDAVYKIYRPEIGGTEDYLLITAISKIEDLIYHYEERSEQETASFEKQLKAQGDAA